VSRGLLLLAIAAIVTIGAVAFVMPRGTVGQGPEADPAARITPARQTKRYLFQQLQPVKLSNCTLERFGEPHDGGYLVCGNLLTAVQSGYSYGINGFDGWGCDVSRKLGVPLHQYDCFNLERPVCEGGNTIFHGECVGAAAGPRDGRPFDTMAGQIAKNGDAGKTLVVKMDVEGAEWDSLVNAPEDLLKRIDQLVVEFHGFDQDRHGETVARLKQYFHVAHLHWNNYSCVDNAAPYPAWAYEVLFVNKRLGIVDESAAVVLPHPLDRPNKKDAPDCQAPRH
jgi:hypothetical protein